jgi:SNF2 family N-terminal domain.
LKNPARYRHHLAGHRWDVVVIDECHNLINRGTQNNELARLLAAHTDALILASATPHNGRAESFAELVGLLDPTAIADPSDYTGEDIAHLYVRRHRNSDDVRLEVAHNWKARRDTEVRWVTPRRGGGPGGTGTGVAAPPCRVRPGARQR